MRFSEAWLREWVDPDISTEALADQLSMAGLEVDSVEPSAPEFTGVVVGEVVAKEKHPDADKLSVCQVTTGSDENLQIVCGAKNVAAGMRVPVATVGAVLPGGFKIKKAKLRGVPSQGMICSASELGLAESSDGIMLLQSEAPIGEDFRAYMALDDQCIEVDLTPDRGDCLSIAGIAREVGVINQTPLTRPGISAVEPQSEYKVNTEVSAITDCPNYICRVIEGVDLTVETPLWMTEKLRKGGIRSINPVVDVTNYVMLELGQPMHGFDLSRLAGAIQVRHGDAGEKLVLLDGNEVDIQPGTLLIADDNGPLALAGIMGGEASGVTESTTSILLESAYFNPLAITGKARGYGLHTDSSHRFERGVDSQLQTLAIERATALLLDITGGVPGPVSVTQSEAHQPVSPVIRLRRSQISRILGITIEDEQVEDILSRLGMTIVPAADGWDVAPPSSRFDVTIEVDLIEELGRIYGYANIPENLSAAPVSVNSRQEASFDLARAKQVMVDRDYFEAVTYSFISPKLSSTVNPGAEPIALANPISADLSVMRTSLWPGLLQTLQYNLARQQDRIRLFESGLQFEQGESAIQQSPMLAGLIYGNAEEEQWGQAAHRVDFYDLKADVEAVLGQLGENDSLVYEAVEDESLHPGQSAMILRNGGEIGRLGMLHPAIQAALDLDQPAYLFSLDLDAIATGSIPAFESLSKYPAIRRDFALLVDKSVTFGQVEACVRRVAPASLRDIGIFDVYTGENIDSTLKSLAISLILQESSHTLTDQEIDQISETVLAALAKELSAKLRD
ncbi:MAG: phenylalanine--tRNA ligase subunit beta [bacterium]